MTHSVLVVPGLRNSGPVHWQSLWQLKHPEYRRVMQRDWDAPHLGEWTSALDCAIREACGKAFLVAHSFGCLAAVQCIAERGDDVAGALLVAPADPEKFGLGHSLPWGELDVPTVLVASRNDPWLAFEKARAMAWRFGSGFVDLGAAGHVNGESGYGPWPEGEQLLARLEAAAAPGVEALAT